MWQRQRKPVGAAREQRLAPVSVPRAVGAFLLAALLVLTVIGVALGFIQRAAATNEAIREARTLTEQKVNWVVGPLLTDELLDPQRGPDRELVRTPAYDRLDRAVNDRVLGGGIVRIKVWDQDGQIVYSDDDDLVGQRFDLPAEEREVLEGKPSLAEVTNLDEEENVAEARDFGQRLLQVYHRVDTPQDTPLLFETYQRYEGVEAASQRLWEASLPVLVSGLVLLYLVQAPLAYRMAVRLRRAQEEREQLMVAGLAASDRERAQIASDLHDGVLQGLAGASYTLSAAVAPARRAGDDRAAEIMSGTARDLRRWARELRSLVVSVAPPTLHTQGLVSALTDLVAPLENRGLEVHLDVHDVEDLDEPTATLVYRVVQEALRNVVRHAHASSITVELSRQPGTLVAEVRDDGDGFDTSMPARRGGSVGLELLARLAEAQGGSIRVDSTIGTGTQLSLRLPVPDPVLPDPTLPLQREPEPRQPVAT